MRRVLVSASSLTVVLAVLFWLFADFGWSLQPPAVSTGIARPLPEGFGLDREVIPNSAINSPTRTAQLGIYGIASRLLTGKNVYPKARVSYEDFENLVQEVESHRKLRLLSLPEFLKKSREAEVIVLDTRSDLRYERIHVQGAKHLSFPDFTQETLAELIPSKDTPILIYCNNNFDGNTNDFPSKMAGPPRALKQGFDIREERKPIMLALNIPTYITLYGYGYRNIYELDELVRVDDPRIKFEGTTVASDQKSTFEDNNFQSKRVDSISPVYAVDAGGPPGLGKFPRTNDGRGSRSRKSQHQAGSWDLGSAQ